MTGCVKPKSENRLRVEAVLMAATHPMSADEISVASGVPIAICRTHISNAVNNHKAYNVAPGSNRESAYLWGLRPAAKKSNVAAPREPMPTEPLVIKPIALRPGADEHKNCPSRRGEVEVPWMPPFCVGQRQLEAPTKGLL